MAASIPHFVAFEVRGVDPLSRLRLLASLRHRAFIAMIWMEMVIYVSSKFGRAMKPWARSDEHAIGKPFWTIITSRCAGIRRDVIVPIWTIRGYTDVHANLSLCFGVKLIPARAVNIRKANPRI